MNENFSVNLKVLHEEDESCVAGGVAGGARSIGDAFAFASDPVGSETSTFVEVTAREVSGLRISTSRSSASAAID